MWPFRRETAATPGPGSGGPSSPGAGAAPSGISARSVPMVLQPHRVRRIRATGIAVSAAVAAFGALRLGWHLLGALGVLAHSPGGPPRVASSAAFLLAGLTILLSIWKGSGSARAAVWVRTGAWGVAILGVAALLLHLAETVLTGAPGLFGPVGRLGGLMAFTSALCFVVLGAALLVLDRAHPARPGQPHPAEGLACAVAAIGNVTLIGWLLSLPGNGLHGHGITPSTSLALIALSIGVVCARPERGFAAVAASTTAGGTLLRWLVPVTLVLPPLATWGLAALPPRGLLDARTGAALATSLGSVVVVGLEIRLALRMAAADSERQANQSSLRRAFGDLAQALRERDRVQGDYERSNRDLDEFAYAASHDLRAPLRGIANLTNFLEEDLGSGLPDSARQQLDLLRGRVLRMESLIDGILKYSRAGRGQEQPQQVSLAELVRETVELVTPPPGTQVVVAPILPSLETERAQLQQVLLNLISNAIKHAQREDPRVEISVEDFGDHLRFVVADNGPGIAPQYQDRIWGMFQTLAPRDAVEGTGIGLATVKKLVERRGGRVGVESEEGKGARFFFLWPRHNVVR